MEKNNNRQGTVIMRIQTKRRRRKKKKVLGEDEIKENQRKLKLDALAELIEKLKRRI